MISNEITNEIESLNYTLQIMAVGRGGRPFLNGKMSTFTFKNDRNVIKTTFLFFQFNI